MKFDKPQKGNPHRLTIKQHIFPAASISRFANKKGVVEVFSSRVNCVIDIGPNNDFFCAKRLWDQHTEEGIGKSVEDKFQALATSIILGRTTTIGLMEKRLVDNFFSLWRIRHSSASTGLEDLVLSGIEGDELTQDEEEILEKKHCMFVRSNGVMPGRFAAGTQFFMSMDSFANSNLNVPWGIVRAVAGEFIVPDCFQEMMVVPLSPTVALMADQKDSFMSIAEVSLVNRIAISKSQNYYFARKLSCCPIYDLTPPRVCRKLSP